MANYTISLTDTQETVLKSCMASPKDYAENALIARASIALNDVLKNYMEHCNANGITMKVGQDLQVAHADELGLIFDASNNHVHES